MATDTSFVPGPKHAIPSARKIQGQISPTALVARYRSYALVGDCAAAIIAAVVAHIVRFGQSAPQLYVTLTLLMPALWIATLALQRGYEARFLGNGSDEYRHVLDSGLLLFTVIAVVSYIFRGDISRGYMLVAIPLTIILTLACRKALRSWLYRLREEGQGLFRVVLVGQAQSVANVADKLQAESYHGLQPVGACIPASSELSISHVHRVPVLGDFDHVVDAVKASGAHVVAVVSNPDVSDHVLRRLSWDLDEMDVDLIVSPGIVEVAGPRLSIRPVAGLSLLHVDRPVTRGGRLLIKTAFDRTVALGLLVVTLPIMLGIAAAIRLTSPGPVLFRQHRVGIDGRSFTMLKFRSMIVGADRKVSALREQSDGNDVLFKMRNDPRVTPVGSWLRRHSLDELPQLINIIKGEMSLVGPRPPLPEEVAGYNSDASRRLRVRPGLTGLWQVSGRSDLSWEESLHLDLRYVDNWSLMLDLSILWRTVRAVLGGSGAY